MTFQRGRPLAAYLYLPGRSGARSVRTEKLGRGIVVDYGEGGEPIGIESTAPLHVSVEEISAVLEQLGQPELATEEYAPLAAA